MNKKNFLSDFPSAREFFGSLGIGVIKTFCTRITRKNTDKHGFLKAFSVRFRVIREIRVQNHGNSQRAVFLLIRSN